ncbi:MAG TPA: hypothetical protein VI585_00160 [Candidatus Binatia bacterium]
MPNGERRRSGESRQRGSAVLVKAAGTFPDGVEVMITKRATDAEIARSLYRQPHKAQLDLETQLVGGVLDYLAVIGCLAFRRNVGAREWLDASGRVKLVRFNDAGMSDVWAIGPGGIHIEVECKRQRVGPRGSLTAEQQAWLNDVSEAGGIAMSVTSLEELAERLRSEFVKRGLPWKRSWML